MINQGVLIGHAMADVVGENAGDGWVGMALDAVRRFAIENDEFTTEQVRFANPDLPVPHDNRAWGAVILIAKKQGFIEASGWVRSESLRVHGTVVTKWSSKIRRQG
jgi:hypothetical protein